MTLRSTLARLERYVTPPTGLACLALVTGGFIALCLTVLLQARADATAAAETQAHNIAASVAQDAARNIDLYDLTLQAVVRGLQWPRVMSLPPDLRQTILFPGVVHARYFGFINVLDEAGTVIADSRSPSPRAGNFVSRDYFVAQRRDARDSLFIGAPFLKGPWAMIPLSRRIAHPDGSFAGVVVGTMRLAYFRDLFARLDIGRHGSIALLRDDGQVLMRLPYQADEIGRMLPPGAPFFQARLGGEIDGMDPIDHRWCRFVFQPVGSLPLVVAVGLADTDIYAAWRRHAALLGAAIMALSLIDLVLLVVLRYALRRREAGLAALRAGEAQRTALIGQREQAVAAMEAAAEAKARFLAVMSHELRTPLSSLLGYAELLELDGGLTPGQVSRLTAMRGAAEHLHGVIDKVLEFSRADADTPQPAVAAIDLLALVSECCAMTEPMAAAKGLRLAGGVAPALPRRIMGDPVAIRQALLNLLGNAVKFTAQGRISVQVVPCADGMRLTVTDTGIGIPAGLRDKLFQPFERLGAERLGVPGTGLGLAITARMVARLGGRIGYEPNPDGGSIFWIELPLWPDRESGQGGQPAATATLTRRLSILVTDDSAPNRDVIAGFLEPGGHSVLQAAGGEEAVRLAGIRDFDVILMDLRMPGMDGLTALRRIRALPGTASQAPVIAVTAQEMSDGGAALRQAGFHAVLVKPVSRVALLQAIAAATDSAGGAATEPWVGTGADGLDDARAENREDETDSLDAMNARIDRLVPDAHLSDFATQVAQLLRLLQAPAAAELPDLVHRIAGDAAQLGYAGLTMAAKRYEATLASGGEAWPEAIAMLRDMAETASEALSQRRGCA